MATAERAVALRAAERLEWGDLVTRDGRRYAGLPQCPRCGQSIAGPFTVVGGAPHHETAQQCERALGILLTRYP